MESSYKLLVTSILILGIATRSSLEYVEDALKSNLDVKERENNSGDSSPLLDANHQNLRRDLGDLDEDEVGMVALVNNLKNLHRQRHNFDQGDLNPRQPNAKSNDVTHNTHKLRLDTTQVVHDDGRDGRNHVEVAGLLVEGLTSEESSAGDTRTDPTGGVSLTGSHDQLDKLNKADQNNFQTASVVVDNSVSEHEKAVAQLDPDSMFLETRTINSTAPNQSVSGVRGHMKVFPPDPVPVSKHSNFGIDRVAFIGIIAACCVAAVAGFVLAGYCWLKLRQETSKVGSSKYPRKLAKEISVSSNQGIGKRLSHKDVELAQSAEVYHYLQAKKQLSQIEKVGRGPTRDFHQDASDSDDDDEDTVYECPGLAPPGDMKVVNPLFSDADRHSDIASDSSLNHDSPPVSNDPPTLESHMQPTSK